MFHLYIIRKYSQALKQRNSFSGRMCITPITAWSSPQETEILITSYYAIPPSMRMYGTVHKSLRCFSPQIIFEPNKKSVRYLFPPQFSAIPSYCPSYPLLLIWPFLRPPTGKKERKLTAQGQSYSGVTRTTKKASIPHTWINITTTER